MLCLTAFDGSTSIHRIQSDTVSSISATTIIRSERVHVVGEVDNSLDDGSTVIIAMQMGLNFEPIYGPYVSM